MRIYDARAARRGALVALVAFVATGRGAAFATFARGAAVAVRAFIMKQRSSARSKVVVKAAPRVSPTPARRAARVS